MVIPLLSDSKDFLLLCSWFPLFMSADVRSLRKSGQLPHLCPLSTFLYLLDKYWFMWHSESMAELSWVHPARTRESSGCNIGVCWSVVVVTVPVAPSAAEVPAFQLWVHLEPLPELLRLGGTV